MTVGGQEALIELLADYEVSTEALRQNMRLGNQQREAYQREMLALLFELKKSLSEDEWIEAFSSGEG